MSLPKEKTPARKFAFLSDAARRYRKLERFEFDFGDFWNLLEFPGFEWAGGNPKELRGLRNDGRQTACRVIPSGSAYPS
jgi:hypothetical protein